MWQDIILGGVSVLLAYALVPQVIRGFKIKKKTISIQTSLIAFIGMLIIAPLYFTMGLYFASGISVVTGILWLIMLIQGIVYKKS